MNSTLLAIPFPELDPVIFQIGPFALRWYSLAYILGVVLGWWYLCSLIKLGGKIPRRFMDDMALWATLGVVIGGRLGYVLFYKTPYYLDHPGEILAVWKGGMSFHGGLIGVIVAVLLTCRKYGQKFFPVIDLVACAAPIGLGLGRIANFINAELYGRATDVPWGVIFPGEDFARHPSQLYQAALEGLALFLLMRWAVLRPSIRGVPARLSGLFLIGYSIARIVVEFYREPDAHIGYIGGSFTMGQLLSVPMLALGLALFCRRGRPTEEPAPTARSAEGADGA